MSQSPIRRPSERLDLKLRLASRGLHEARARLWAHPELPALFPSLLFRMHCEARATIKLMEMAIAQLETQHRGDPLAAPLIEYFGEHIPEELGHDDWLLHSLEALGFRSEDVWAQIPPGTVAGMVGSQYYWILHKHPVALLGYIKVVESDPNTKEQVDSMIARTGLPRDAFKFHFGHVNLEPKHNADLDQLLDSLPLSAEHEALIGISLMRTVHAIAAGVEETLALYERGAGTRNPTAHRDPSVELF